MNTIVKNEIIEEVKNGNLSRLHSQTIHDVCEHKTGRVPVRVGGRKKVRTIFRVAGQYFILDGGVATSNYNVIKPGLKG